MKYYCCSEVGDGNGYHYCAGVKFISGYQVCGDVQRLIDYAGHPFCACLGSKVSLDPDQLSLF